MIATLLYDGDCALCNRFVQFAIARDKMGKLVYVSQQSADGQRMLKRYGYSASLLDTVVLVEAHTSYERSSAALRTLRLLGTPWSFLYIFIIFPTTLRDPFYNWIASKRYAWFGTLSSE
jgi:predicted DCC family thiol-disulfide oxidoreductase YuxK